VTAISREIPYTKEGIPDPFGRISKKTSTVD
jgi:hypothetical protein